MITVNSFKNSIRLSHKRITIALLFALIVVSGCVGTITGTCDADTASNRVNIEQSTIDACIDACRAKGLGWKTQIYGQSEGKGIVYCTCYSC